MADCAIASNLAEAYSPVGQCPGTPRDKTLEVAQTPSSISDTPCSTLIKASPAHKSNRHSRNISSTSSTKTPKLSATITSLIDEPLFYSNFLSDEAVTPISDTAGMSSSSIYSYKDALSQLDDFELNFPELLLENASYIDQQCIYAHAVHVVAVGPPKIIDLMRADRPAFKRASQIMLQRPIQRPALSPIQTRIPRKSVSSIHSESSVSSGDRKTDSTHRSSPTTPVLENDEPLSPSSEYSPATPYTPKSSFEREISAVSSKDSFEPPLPTTSTLKSHVRMPSRLRLFPRRTSSAAAQASTDNKKALPTTPPLTPDAAPSTTHQHRNRFFARGADEREPLLELPPSPTSVERPSIKQAGPQRSIWKEANTPKNKVKGFAKAHKLRRVESKIGLNSN